MTAAEAISQMREVGITVDVVGGVVLLSGGNRHARDVWRPVVDGMREQIIALVAPPRPVPAQAALPWRGRP